MIDKSPIELRAENYFRDNMSFSKNEYGKYMGPISEGAVLNCIKCLYSDKILPIKNLEDLRLKTKINNDGSAIQIKFRQIERNKLGQISPSRGLYLENTRRVSGKNKNESSKSGHVVYKVSEQDYFLFCLDIDEKCFKLLKNMTPKQFTQFEKTGFIEDIYWLNYYDFLIVSSLSLEDSTNVGFIVNRITKKIFDEKKFNLINGKDYIEKISNLISVIK